VARTLTDEDIEAIARRVAELIGRGAASPRTIDAGAIYSVEEAAALTAMHTDTLRRKLRTGMITGSRRTGEWRIRGAELLKLA
jgi:excisionase family DNA binding protein